MNDVPRAISTSWIENRVEIATARLTLRRVAPDDIDVLVRIERDQHYSFFARPGPVTREFLAREFIEGARPGSDKLALCVRFEQEIIGHVILLLDRDNDTAMLGYGIARGRWGQGFGTEAARAAIGYGFIRLGVAKVWARLDPRNLGSVRLLENVGMEREGLLRSHVLRRGERCDRAYYGILRERWTEPGPS